MEEKLIGEQPVIATSEVQSGIVENVEEGITCSGNSGSLGKFKDTESLLKAYNSLQAEFTKKCQKLSEFMKNENSDGLLQVEQNEKEVATYTCEEKNNLNQEADELNINSKINSVPIYKSDEWNKKVADFLENNKEAKEFANQISNEILNDENLQKNENALELAWARVMKKEYAQPNKLAHDQNFIREQILSQDQIKWQILEEYFKNIQTKKTPPLITSSGVVAGITTKQPTTMNEAKEAVQKLFNLKGN